MLFRNHASVAAMAVLCTMFCAMPAHAEDDGDGGVYIQHPISGASVVTSPPIRSVPLSAQAIYPAQYNGDVRDLPQVYTPPEYHTLNDFPTPMPQRTLPPGGDTNAPQPPPIQYAPMPATLQNFAGLGFGTSVAGGTAGGGWPPDTNGDVGPTYYIQSVNTAYGIFNKTTGAMVAAFKENQLWQGAGTGTVCDANHQGDPVVIHDGLSDRWVLTDFAFTFSGQNPVPPYYQCIAVSKTSDPVSGGWYLYAVQMDSGVAGAPPNGTFADYPKFGFWTDCLYMGANGFDSSGNYGGGIVAAFDRTALFSGAALTGTNSSIAYTADSNIFGMFPANLQAGDGSDPSKLPPSGTNEYFVVTSASIYGFDVRKFLAGSTACGSGATLSSPTSVATASYGYPALPTSDPNNPYTTDIVKQPGASKPKLDSLGDEIMQRVVYRNVGGAESLWLVHTTCGPTIGAGGVCANSTTTTRPQWAQINVTGGTIATTPVQQQIYAPDTTLYRWMGSLAVDSQGNMALGYSRSNATSPNYAGLAYAGRLASDPLNQLPQTEVVMQAGAGAQNTYNRWGDYSAMTVDPSDDCTFWYTNEYYAATGTSWQTRIGSFKFPGCVGAVKQNQTITFPNPGPLTYSPSGTFALTATASSGLTVTYASTTTGVCTVSGSTATIVSAGTCTINADQAGDASYNAAPTVTDNITINKANQAITFTSTAPAGATVGGATYGVTATGGASGNAVTFSIDASSSGVCTISGSTVSFTGVGTCTIDANQAGNTNYNAAPQAQQSFAVGKGSQTITFTSTAPAGAVVGGATYNVTATSSAGLTPVTFTIDASSSGVCTIAGSAVSFTGVGTCTIDANQAGNANYSAAPQAQQSFAVGKGSQTITFTSTAPAGAVVGGTAYNVTATSSAGLTPVTFTIDAASSGVCTIAGSTVSFTGVGTCTIDANQAGNANYNAAPQKQQSFAVGKGSQTITFPNPGAQTYSAGGTFAVSATSTSGLTVTFTSTTPSVCTVAGTTVTILSGGTCSIAADQTGNANYNAAPTVTDNITINKASQTVTFPNPGAQTYSAGGTFAVSATATSGLTVTFTSATPGVCTVSGSTVNIVSAGTCTINADQAGNANYSAAATVPDNITINPASQSITFTSTPPGSATVGGPTYTVTANGGASGNAVTFTIDPASSGVCTISGATVSFIATGSCLIDANQAGNANYAAAAQAQQSVAVGVASQTITFPNPGPVTYSLSGTFGLTATGGASGNPVTYISNTTGVCTVAGSTATIVSAGTCSITASQSGNASYGAATPVTDLVTINPASQTIAFTSTPPASPAYGGSYVVSANGGASGNPVTFTIDAASTAGACSISGSTVSFTGTGSCIVDADQAGNANYTAATQQQQGFTIGAANQAITFTSTPPSPAVVGAPAYTVTAMASSTLPVTLSIDAGSASVCTLSGSASGSTVSFIGIGTCTIDADQAGNANYNPAPQSQQSFTVDVGTVSLVFTTQPADVAQGSTQGTIAVTEQNQYGYIVSTDSSSAVNFTVSSCGGTSLGSATMTNGVATLSDSTLRFYTVAPGLTVNAASSGAFSGSTSSNTFNVTANAGIVFSDGFESCRP